MAKRGRRDGGARRRGGLHGWVVAALLFALAGVVASGIAWRTHWQVRSNPPAAAESWCKLSEKVDCSKTALSDYAVFLRVPVAIWSALAFVLLIVLGLAAVRREPPQRFGSGLLFATSVVTAGVSVTFAIVARFVLHVLCIECTMIQAAAVVVCVCAALHLRERRIGPVAALREDFGRMAERRGTTAAVGLLALVGAGLLAAFYPQHRPADVGPTGRLTGPGDLPTGVTPEGHPFIGGAEPRVTIVEYSDYECPFCRQAHVALRDAVRRHPDRIRLIHVHFPLDMSCNPALRQPFHAYACRLAAAACCAGRQGRFWEMNDAIFEGQTRGSAPDVTRLARAAGVPDAEAFADCMATGSGRERVRRDAVLGARMLLETGLDPGTPVFEIFDASGRGLGRYLGFGGEQGIPREMLRRLDAGWPEEWEGTRARGEEKAR